MRIGIIGLGKLGLPVAETMSRLYPVNGYDLRTVSSENINVLLGIGEVAANSDMVFIAVPTPHDPRYDGSQPTSHLDNLDFDYSSVLDVLDDLNGHVDDTKTVVLISTVLPGTTRRLLSSRIPNAKLIYNPYLIAMGTVAEDFVDPEMIMIGTADGERDQHVDRLIGFYRSLVKVEPRIEVGTWEEMECTKIFYNTFISAKLGLVNMIQDVAERIGHTNVDIVANALAQSRYRITGTAYMKPGMGDGGPCHPRDNIALRWLAERLDLGYDLFDSIMHAREVQAMNIAEELVSHGLPVVILGKSFKPSVAYTDGSYSMLVGHYVKELGAQLSYDQIIETPAAYLLAHNTDYTDVPIPNGSVVVDPWRKHPHRDGIKLIRYGDTRNIGSRVGRCQTKP